MYVVAVVVIVVAFERFYVKDFSNAADFLKSYSWLEIFAVFYIGMVSM